MLAACLKPNSCQLEHFHNAGEWPWSYSATQNITVRDNILKHSVSVKNESSQNMPAGLGFHPYFAKLNSAKLQFNSDGFWNPNEEYLPTSWQPLPSNMNFSKPLALSNFNLDHCFTHVSEASISWEDTPLVIRISQSDNLKWAAVYTDHKNDCFCFEPVSHAHNALNMDDPAANGIVNLKPGSYLTAWMEICVSFEE